MTLLPQQGKTQSSPSPSHQQRPLIQPTLVQPSPLQQPHPQQPQHEHEEEDNDSDDYNDY